ncbi:Nucleoid occlusion protein [Aquisphaera giovannonii]|uniref:Nucleoid occlusion protein n=1 Tax=Aquisphaera giovannonii TaxID=406548 RepID=A0A5B9W3Y3_9BACT|nr:DNA methyltransferase [Aquisphaera giovannonii]QEH35302.1 Nucleoid occlusion protein [Aquisphaera giovannonii]
MHASAPSPARDGSAALDPGQAVRPIDPRDLIPSDLSRSIYGDPAAESADLMESIRVSGILVPLVVTPAPDGRWEILSGHRRWTCALSLQFDRVPCEIRPVRSTIARQHLILEYNRYRNKSFSQLMREADVLEEIVARQAKKRSLGNLRHSGAGGEGSADFAPGIDRRNSDDQAAGKGRGDDKGRTDATIAERLGIGGKDVYRQARAVWKAAGEGDVRARSGVDQLDAGTKTIHAAYKDLRRRGRFSADFKPTPYDVWAFRHDRAFGIPHPGSIPPAIVAHALHYFSPPGGLVVDPMAGGGTTLDVCESMGRRCLAYDLEPTRPDIRRHDIRLGFPPEAAGADLIFCDPPYHSMLARSYPDGSVATLPLSGWIEFLEELARRASATLRPGGHFAILLASQTEKDLPAGHGYIDHAFLGYSAILRAGLRPERRISCPMDGAYLPQQVRRARTEGRLLGQVRDLIVGRKPSDPQDGLRGHTIPGLQ